MQKVTLTQEEYDYLKNNRSPWVNYNVQHESWSIGLKVEHFNGWHILRDNSGRRVQIEDTKPELLNKTIQIMCGDRDRFWKDVGYTEYQKRVSTPTKLRKKKLQLTLEDIGL